MKEYLRVGAWFSSGVGFSPRHSDEQVRIGTHAIDSHDELVALNQELLAALEGLLADMRLRAQLEGDVDSDGRVVLNCGNSVLHAVRAAIAKAKGDTAG